MKTSATTIDEYLDTISAEARATLAALRETIRAAAPEAVESISYGVPTFKYKGKRLAYLGAWRTHCAMYGMRLEGHEQELSAYDTSKGTIRFQPGQPPPEGLVRALIEKRVAKIEAAAAAPKRPRRSGSATP